MKYAITFTLAASLVASSAAASHNHHAHHHAKKHAEVQGEAAKVEKRAPSVVTHYVPGETEVVYVMGGKVVDADEAKNGIDGGNFLVVGESTPTFSPPPPPPAPTTTSSEADMGAQFIEKPTTTAEPTTAAPTTTSVAPKPKPTTSKAAAPPADDSGSSGGSGLDRKFPSGQVKCSDFPKDYGAIPIDWLDMNGWSALQFVPDFTSLATTISTIIGGVKGDDCSDGAMCSYACPPGYQKTQWPKAQGSTKQSVGGLYCKDGFLELTRESSDTLCEKGVGGVSVQNDLDEEVCLCRTDYPSSEAMVIPACAPPGGTVQVTNPDQTTYYQWGNDPTSAQWYLNKKGYSKEEACVWDSPKDPKGAGNWSPVIIGTGRAADGISYLSIFNNAPTSNAKLDFNVEMTGDTNGDCALVDGSYSGGSNGCTTGMPDGGSVVIRYFN